MTTCPNHPCAALAEHGDIMCRGCHAVTVPAPSPRVTDSSSVPAVNPSAAGTPETTPAERL